MSKEDLKYEKEYNETIAQVLKMQEKWKKLPREEKIKRVLKTPHLMAEFSGHASVKDVLAHPEKYIK